MISIIMGSDSDLKVMMPAIGLLKDFKVKHEVKVVSAHRTPAKMNSYAKKARARGVKVIIAGAGGSAHLPGMIAAQTTLPVIGVPVQLKNLKGLDSLLSIVQMPKGVPVATMAIDNSYNAGLLAIRILSLNQPGLVKKLNEFSKSQKSKVSKANQTIKNFL